jgi:hypothetical protein
MDRSLLTLIIALGLAAVFCVPAARRSIAREKIHGGSVAESFHLAGVFAYLAVLPSALCGSFLVGPLEFGIPLALGFLALALLALFGYGVIERPARAKVTPTEDRGWTAEDARSSGL